MIGSDIRVSDYGIENTEGIIFKALSERKVQKKLSF